MLRGAWNRVSDDPPTKFIRLDTSATPGYFDTTMTSYDLHGSYSP